MSVPHRAILTAQFSHIMVTRIRLSEPQRARQTIDPEGRMVNQWADAALQILLQDTRADDAEPLMLLSAANLYPGGAHAAALHMETLRIAIEWLSTELDTLCRREGITGVMIDAMAAKGVLSAEVLTQVPRTAGDKAPGGITLTANYEPPSLDVAGAVRATNPAMVLHLARALNDVRSKGVAAADVRNVEILRNPIDGADPAG